MKMHGKAQKILLCVLMISLLAVFTSCGSGDRSEPPAGQEAAEDSSNAKDVIGVYKLTRLVSEGKESVSEEIEVLESMGLSAELSVSSDGTATLDLFNETMEFTWDENFFYRDGLPMDYMTDNGLLVIGTSSGSDIMEFQLIEE